MSKLNRGGAAPRPPLKTKRESGCQKGGNAARHALKEHVWDKYQDGQPESRQWLRALAGNGGAAEVYREMLPEFCQVLMDDPMDRYPDFTFREELLLYLDEKELECRPVSRA